ncbi:hypothetical protein HDU76_010926 [Blyttiomyces sp. JEL0837]|nr:hypothetical protein HDU76_010926 [Blyttiomyces sp. JEL0837]
MSQYGRGQELEYPGQPSSVTDFIELCKELIGTLIDPQQPQQQQQQQQHKYLPTSSSSPLPPPSPSVSAPKRKLSAASPEKEKPSAKALKQHHQPTDLSKRQKEPIAEPISNTKNVDRTLTLNDIDDECDDHMVDNEVDEESHDDDMVGNKVDEESHDDDIMGNKVDQESHDVDIMGNKVDEESHDDDIMGSEVDTECHDDDIMGSEVDTECHDEGIGSVVETPAMMRTEHDDDGDNMEKSGLFASGPSNNKDGELVSKGKGKDKTGLFDLSAGKDKSAQANSTKRKSIKKPTGKVAAKQKQSRKDIAAPSLNL